MYRSLRSAVQWLLAIVGAGLSGTVIVLTLLPILKANAAKGDIIISLWIQHLKICQFLPFYATFTSHLMIIEPRLIIQNGELRC